MKIVKFLDKEFEVPNWANYITSDEFGIAVWEVEPRFDGEWLHNAGMWIWLTVEPLTVEKMKIGVHV